MPSKSSDKKKKIAAAGASTSSQPDFYQPKEFEHNKYATRKTITQGFIDVALLMTNVAQLKFLLDLGSTYSYYTLLVTLFSVSIALQIIRGILNVTLGVLYNIGEEDHQVSATVLNNIVMALGALSTIINTIASGFDMSTKIADGTIHL
ncbi:ninjurin-1-like [Periplaneta americana]|uniref:ninjurin-1-like n=1 Tax=Periplaneta americana TaxID=6978 RepID=UPI0037E7E161